MEDKIEYEEVIQFPENSITPMVPLLLTAHSELQDFGTQGVIEFLMRVKKHLSASESLMLKAYVGTELVGVCSVQFEDDVHVGPCCSVHWQYIMPEYRGRIGVHFMRWVFSTAKRLRVPFVAYVKRMSDTQHVVTYRRVSDE